MRIFDNQPEATDALDSLPTEAVADATLELDALSTGEVVRLMNQRDAFVTRAVAAAMPHITAAIEATVERMRAGGRLIYVGAGTSGRLGVLDASEIPPTFGADPGLVIGIIAGGAPALQRSAESVEDDASAGAADVAALGLTGLDTVVGVASSGRTPYVLGAVQYASGAGALTLGVSCNGGTELSSLVDYPVEVQVGPEIISGSTRLGAGTATKMVLNMISTAAMISLGKTYRSLMVDVRATNVKLRRRAVRIVTAVAECDPATASAALEQSGWQTKDAIVMVALGHDAGTAHELLTAAGGSLRKVLGH